MADKTCSVELQNTRTMKQVEHHLLASEFFCNSYVTRARDQGHANARKRRPRQRYW